MTKKLYDLDAYQREFEAEVISCQERKKKDGTAYEVILNQTLFFPEEGGQSPDRGTIEGVKVLDVQIKKNVIVHKLISKGTVEEKIDELIKSKVELSQQVIGDGKETWITEMNNEELMNLLRLDAR